MTKLMTTISFPTGEYVVVPVEATDAMKNAGVEKYQFAASVGVPEYDCDDGIDMAWLAMLAAVPAIQPEVVVHEGDPVAWFEAEESCRGADLKKIINGMCVSTRWHWIKKPETTNPVWALFTHPPKPAQDKRGLILTRFGFDKEGFKPMADGPYVNYDDVCMLVPAQDNAALIEALEIGLDAARLEASEYLMRMHGYDKEKHDSLAADVRTIEAAIASLNVGHPAQEGW